MTTSAVAVEPVPGGGASKSLPARVVGLLFAPRATYTDIAARPSWFGALAFIVLVGSSCTFAFLSTEVGRRAWVDAAVQQRESYGRTTTDAQYERIEQMSSYAAPIGAVAQLAAMPVAGAIIAGLAFSVFNVMLVGDAAFRQVFAIVVHSGVVMCLAQLFGTPLAYVRESLSGATNLAVFVPFLDETSFPARLLGAIDLFVVWWIVSLAIGLGVLYGRRTAPIATTLIVVYVTIGVVVAVIKTLASGA